MTLNDAHSTVARTSRLPDSRSERPQVSVVIPVRNDPENLRACLGALRESRGVTFEVVVVDDASSDETPEVARSLGARVLSLPRNVGPAIARNEGCRNAEGEFVVFLDADVCAAPDTLQKFVATFQHEPHVAAIFGSYDTRPTRTNLVSQYKNLLHHFVHQQGQSEASTFWSGCGAVRREAFLELDGFNAGYGRPCIEDIEFGSRLRNVGERIRLNKEIQVTHRKHWSLRGMIKADVFDRAIPWTRLILRNGQMPNDLNLRTSQRVSALLACLVLLLVIVAAVVWPWAALFPVTLLAALWGLDRFSLTGSERPAETYALAGLVWLVILGLWGVALWPVFGALLALPLLLLGAIVSINHELFAFFLRERGPWFAFLMIPLHVLYYLYSSATFAYVVLTHKLGIGREAL